MESGLDISNNLPLTEEQKSSYITRMKAAWARLPDEKKAALKPMLDEAHQQYAGFVAKKTPPQHKFHNILRMKSYLTNDWDGHLQAHQQQVAGRDKPWSGSLCGALPMRPLSRPWLHRAGMTPCARPPT